MFLRTQHSPSMMKVAKYNQPAIRSQPGHLRDWCHIGTPCRSLLLAPQASSTGCGQIRLDERKPVLLRPFTASTLPHGHSSWALFSHKGNKGGWEMRLTTIHRKVHLIHLIIRFLFGWGHFLGKIYMENKYFYILCPYGRAIHIALPQITLLPIF